MITIPLSYVLEKTNASVHATRALELINAWTQDLAIPNGIMPMVAGGMVRDVYFQDNEPHDVDMFFVRTSDTSSLISSSEASGMGVMSSVMEWLEDHDVTWSSLSRESIREYSNETSFLDIVEFQYEGIRYQLMFHENLQHANSLMGTFPVMCRAALSPHGIHFPLTGYAAMNAGAPVAIVNRDWRYVSKKYPLQNVLQFSSTSELVGYIAPYLDRDAGTTPRYVVAGSGDGGMTFAPNSSLPPPSGFYSTTQMLKRSIKYTFSLPETEELANVVLSFPNGSSIWNRNRVGR